MISELLGWAYFICWSVSFWPQILLNHSRRSIAGLSLDFVRLNFVGFSCYAVYTLAMFGSAQVQEEYRRVWGSASTVKANDVAFAVHALIACSIALAQTIIYAPIATVPFESRWSTRFIGGCMTGQAVAIALHSGGFITTLDILYYLSMVKMATSLVKYIPQAVLNHVRQSTHGWSIHNILLDLAGGVLSIAQLFYDASLNGGWAGVLGNPIKWGLGLVSIVFDVLFIVQHYVLYPVPLLGNDEENIDSLDVESLLLLDIVDESGS